MRLSRFCLGRSVLGRVKHLHIVLFCYLTFGLFSFHYVVWLLQPRVVVIGFCQRKIFLNTDMGTKRCSSNLSIKSGIQPGRISYTPPYKAICKNRTNVFTHRCGSFGFRGREYRLVRPEFVWSTGYICHTPTWPHSPSSRIRYIITDNTTKPYRHIAVSTAKFRISIKYFFIII